MARVIMIETRGMHGHSLLKENLKFSGWEESNRRKTKKLSPTAQ